MVARREVIGILYDELVCNYPIVEQLMWWHSTAVEFIVPAGPGVEPVMCAVKAINFYFRDSPSGIELSASVVPELNVRGLDRLWIVRSHPEMFGAEIRAWAGLHGSLTGALIVTYEKFGDGGQRMGEKWRDVLVDAQ